MPLLPSQVEVGAINCRPPKPLPQVNHSTWHYHTLQHTRPRQNTGNCSDSSWIGNVSPTPQDLQSWIAGAGSAGVVYFSLGSVASGENLPLKYRQVFLEAFRKLSQRVLWKYEGEMEEVSDNVKLSKWLPQQDILGKQK